MQAKVQNLDAVEPVSEDDIESIVAGVNNIFESLERFTMALMNVPTVGEAYYSGHLVHHQQGDDSWAAVRADSGDLLMPRKLIERRASTG
ncbi:hypothetical protein BGZ82_000439 [Podila clonocystis]|nr:hypothetical protein BGZ82_000439 [Podila clonocystis]